MTSDYRVLKLVNGITIVGDVIDENEDIIILYPLEVYSKPAMDATNKIIGEHMVLRPYLIMSTDVDVVIASYNILTTNRLDERLYNSYEEMVKSVYKKAMVYDGGFFKEGNQKPANEYTVEEAEYLQEIINTLILNKDSDGTIH